jgi:hypothetical protein
VEALCEKFLSIPPATDDPHQAAGFRTTIAGLRSLRSYVNQRRAPTIAKVTSKTKAFHALAVLVAKDVGTLLGRLRMRKFCEDGGARRPRQGVRRSLRVASSLNMDMTLALLALVMGKEPCSAEQLRRILRNRTPAGFGAERKRSLGAK